MSFEGSSAGFGTFSEEIVAISCSSMLDYARDTTCSTARTQSPNNDESVQDMVQSTEQSVILSKRKQRWPKALKRFRKRTPNRKEKAGFAWLKEDRIGTLGNLLEDFESFGCESPYYERLNGFSQARLRTLE